MKKIIIALLLGSLILTGCGKKEEETQESKRDYSQYSFTNVSWIRDNGHDEETIRFNADGSFSYFCACGNPVNDADLCESYIYDDKTKEIKLDCLETTDETITTIKIASSSDDKLKLDFNGEIRTFEKNN